MHNILSRFLAILFFLSLCLYPAIAVAGEMAEVNGTGCQAMGESLSMAAAKKMAKDNAIKNAIEGVMVSSQSLFVDVSGSEGKEEYQSIMRIVETTVAGRIENPVFSDFREEPKGTFCLDVAGRVDMAELREQVNAIQGVDPGFEEQLHAKIAEYNKGKQPKDAAEAETRAAALADFILKKPVVQVSYGEAPGSDNKTPKQTKAEAETKALALSRKVALNRLVSRLADLPPGVLAVPLPQAKNILDTGLKLVNKSYMDQAGKPVAEPIVENGVGIAIVKAAYAYQGPVKPLISTASALPAGGTAKGAAAGASMVVMTLKVNGIIPPEVRKQFSTGLEKELAKTYKLFAGKKVAAAEDKAVENYEANDCYDDDRCAADVANALGASFIAFPSVVKGASGDYFLTLRIYDVAAEEDIFEEESQCPACGEAAVAAAFGELAKSAVPAQ